MRAVRPVADTASGSSSKIPDGSATTATPRCVIGDAWWLHQLWCDWRAWRRVRRLLNRQGQP